MSELPQSWSTAKVGEVATEVRSGYASGRHNADSVGIPHLRPMNVSRLGNIDLTVVKYVARDAGDRRLKSGDVLFNNTNSPELVGKTAVFEEAGEFGFSNHMTRVRLSDQMDPVFVGRQLHYLWMSGRLRALISNHVNQASIASSRLASDVSLAVPPRAEQERIVTAIEEAFSMLDAGEAGLQIVRRRLKRMREAVFAAAVAGRLVPQDPTDTPAAKLIAHLGNAPPSDLLPALPPGWAETTIGAVSTMSLGKMLDTKMQTGAHPQTYLRNVNVRWFAFDLSDLAVMDIRPDEIERVSVMNGDLVVCEGGQPGRCAVWRGCPVVIQKALHRVRPMFGVNSDYLALVLSWWVCRPEYDRFVTGTTIRHIPKEKLRLLPVPLPPTEEQMRIVAEVDRQLSFIDACERGVDLGLTKSNALRRSTLKAAFEGRLVAQDSSDESASVLLARVRAEHAAIDGSNGGRRRQKVETS